jgi:hypothetical protein
MWTFKCVGVHEAKSYKVDKCKLWKHLQKGFQFLFEVKIHMIKGKRDSENKLDKILFKTTF